jgi:hypothetical protein
VRQRLREIYAEVPGEVFGEIVEHMRALDAAPAQLAHHVEDVLYCRHIYSFSVSRQNRTYAFMLALREDAAGEWSIVDLGFGIEEED